jgi:formylglycine-generating enzyme required for sulfatase activity
LRRLITVALVVAGSSCALDWRGAWPDAARDLSGGDGGRPDRAGVDWPSPSDYRSDSILAPTWIAIPAGRFIMGSPPSEACREADPREKRHVVELTHSFEIMASEVTLEVFRGLLGYKPYVDASCQRCPAEYASWHDAVALCNALSASNNLERCYTNKGSQKGCFKDSQCAAKENCSQGLCAVYEASAAFAGDIYHCPGYRLPTEAEFEYAYRAGSTAAYYDGSTSAACNDCSVPNPADKLCWYYCNAGELHPVMKKPPNGWGLYDMAGNVWEWCHDWYADDLGAAAQIDPVTDKQQSLPERAIRGGGYDSPAGLLRAAQRYSAPPNSRWSSLGFRCVRTLER